MTVTPTARQLEMLRFITGYQIAHDGISPSLDECRAPLGLAGKGGVRRLLDAIEDRGLIHRLPNRARAIEVLAPVPIPRAPDGAPLHAVAIPALREGAH